MSAPARSSACTCSTVALTSLVTVLVIDCTVIGESPPTGTLPTWIVRQARRWMSRYGRTLIVNLAKLALWLIERFGDGKKTATREPRSRRGAPWGRARHRGAACR